MSSFVQISRSVLRGASSGGLQNGIAGAGGAGFSASASTVLIHGGGGNSVAGAVAWEAAPQGIVALGSAGPGARVDSASTFARGVDVAIAGGAGSATLPAAPPILQAPGTIVYALPDRLPTVSLTPAAVSLGTTLTVTLSGQPGDHFRVVALHTAPAVAQQGAYGSLLVDLATAIIIEVVTLGASGSATVLVPVPQDPAFLGIQIVEQAAQALSFGILLSPPVLCSVVP